MKKTLFSLIAAALVFCGCNNKNVETSTLTLNIGNADGRTVYLCWTADDGMAMVDSSVITDGTAMMAIPHSDPQTLYWYFPTLPAGGTSIGDYVIREVTDSTKKT